MCATNTERCFYNRNSESLAAIAQIGHIARFGNKQLVGRVVAIRRNQVVEMFLYFLEMTLTIPQGIIGVESYHTEISNVYLHFLQCGQVPLII